MTNTARGPALARPDAALSNQPLAGHQPCATDLVDDIKPGTFHDPPPDDLSSRCQPMP
ncbi:MAG: hypothetical protein J2P17_10655 [Mycobacterium sp.]|nr:hypothetical protein [Mycobacterium sp.]